jgi:hypothetical protein
VMMLGRLILRFIRQSSLVGDRDAELLQLASSNASRC